MTSDEFRNVLLKRAADEVTRLEPGRRSHQAFDRFCALSAEQAWVDDERPFYNVWPIAENLARDVTLDLPFSAIEIPFDSIVLRFALGHEPYKICTAMLFWPKKVGPIHHRMSISCVTSQVQWTA